MNTEPPKRDAERGPQRVPVTPPTGRRAREGKPRTDGGTFAAVERALRWHKRRECERSQQ